MSDLYQSLSHSKWDCKYYAVFIPKRRRKAVFGKMRSQLGEIFHALGRQKECQILEGHLMPDHVHMCIAIPPKHPVASVIGFLKGKSAIAIARLGREPAGYRESLKRKEPEIIFDPSKLHTKAGWIAAGKLVFESDTRFFPAPPEPPADGGGPFPVSKEGTFYGLARYYIRTKDVLEVGSGSCAGCHTRVMPDDSLWEAAARGKKKRIVVGRHGWS